MRHVLLPTALILLLSAPAGAQQGKPIRVACLGDSITAGDGLADAAKESYPAVLQKLLGTDYEVRNYGVNAATLLAGNMQYQTKKEFAAARSFAPDIVIVIIGTNDSKDVDAKNVARFRTAYTDLITEIRGKWGRKTRIVICAPPAVEQAQADAVWGIRKNVVAKEINAAVKTVGKAAKADVVDLHEVTAKMSSYTLDGVHPRAEGAEKIAETLASTIQKAKR